MGGSQWATLVYQKLCAERKLPACCRKTNPNSCMSYRFTPRYDIGGHHTIVQVRSALGSDGRGNSDY